MLSIAQLERIRTKDTYTYETLKQIVAAINSIAQQTGADPKGVFATTPQITACNVVAANGIFNVQIVDNAFVQNPQLQGRAITYYVEFATDAGFLKVVHHEAWSSTRNGNIFLGNQTLYIRAYSQLQGSAPSAPVAHTGGAVIGGGVAAPTQQAYQGSGTASVSGQGHGKPLRT